MKPVCTYSISLFHMMIDRFGEPQLHLLIGEIHSHDLHDWNKFCFENFAKVRDEPVRVMFPPVLKIKNILKNYIENFRVVTFVYPDTIALNGYTF